LHLAFLHDALNGHFAAMAPGVGILHLTADRMLDWPVPLAPREEQTEILTRANRALTAARTHETLVREMRKGVPSVEASVLARAFRGELVPQDPHDESAESLLAGSRAPTTEPPTRPSSVRKKRNNKSAA
jgi:type I restriction enzyme S subunit